MFWGKEPKHKALIELYTSILIPALGNEKHAKKAANDFLKMAIQESKNEGSNNLPSNLGDIILGDAETDNPQIKVLIETVRERIPAKKDEGVTDEDIRWIWNLDDIERRMMEKVGENAQLALFLSKLDEYAYMGKEKATENSGAAVRKYHPMYGDPADDSYSQNTGTGHEDRLLPYELRNRINKYIEKRSEENVDDFKTELENSSTFNALIRREIRDGSL